MPYPFHRAFGLVIGLGMLLTGIGLALGGALGGGASAMAVAALVGAGLVMIVAGTAAWVLVDRPVKDPYEQPPPDYGHAEGEH